ncbi:putative disease resistance RPP13-like protein 1 [Morella rubra]|uniref:Putative disease resistance RPP13-like protein 1 n=1 Tax=Morella rubra TaxID=262757 RepID=A0A6A1WKC4_9ROSI|nr:putative disease resistance RPP13-like protein 1 [Morella rubra]
MTTLYNLQTLLLKKCALKNLPSNFEKLVNLRHLNIEGANLLEGLPPRIGKLTSLQTLSNLVLGERSGSGIQDLGPLSQLRGTLCISKLEKVIEAADAEEANLIDKSKLQCLLLEWSRDLDESHSRTREEFDVLNMLRPNNSLKELSIKHYGCTKFPTWLRGPSFPNMVLRIENCKSCTSLPPVGQLASLKDLSIRGMAAVKNIGPEFYGEGCSQPFNSLETLSFCDMKEWEHWIPGGEFPRLRHLCIGNCPKLLGTLPHHLPSLENVEISGCGNFVVPITNFPEHCKLQIDYSKAVVCKNTVDFSSLRFWRLSTISEFSCRIEGFNMGGLTNVESLKIGRCEEMRPLWSNEVGLLQHLPHLRSLNIEDCPRLVSLVAEEVEEQLPSGFVHTVKEIRIENCAVLQSLPKSMMYNNTCLHSMELFGCCSVTHIAIGLLPPTLKILRIQGCARLMFLLDDGGDNINSCRSTSLLKRLDIMKCGSLKCLTLSGELPATLKYLSISDCGHLESAAKRLPHNSLLEEINILDCDDLKSLPMGLDNLVHLYSISITGCPNLVWSPNGDSLPQT